MAKRSKRKRVSRDDVRKNATEGGGGGSSWINLPDGVRDWAPEKAGSYLIDVVPYETTDSMHPDDIEKQSLWYKRQYEIHHNIGVNNDSIVCPKSIHKPCPICEEREKLLSEGADWDDDVVKSLGTQKFIAFNILDPEDESKICIFAMSTGKFYGALKKELGEGEEDILDFFDITSDGKTLKVRFSDASYSGKKYLEATRIDFRPREEMDEDEILGKVVNLDEMLNVIPHNKIKAMFLQIEMDEDGDEPEEKPKPKPRQKKEKKAEPEDDEPEEKSKPEPEPEPEDDEAICPVCDDDFEVEDGEKVGKVLYCSKKCAKKAAKSKPEPEPEEDEPEEKPKKGKDKPAAKDKKKCPVEGGKFGKSVDKFDECDDCPLWDDCEAASDE